MPFADLEDNERIVRAAAFAAGAADYDRFRPIYPSSVIDVLMSYVPPTPGTRVLDIGAGTGQMTLPLLNAGYDVTALDVSVDMCALLRRNLDRDTSCAVVNASLEDHEADPESFGLIVAATSFHWMDPATRSRDVTRLLAPKGVFAVLFTEHVMGGTVEFWKKTSAIYDSVVPDKYAGGIKHADDIDLGGYNSEFADLDRIDARVVTFDVTYNSTDYVGLLSTYSDHRTLPDAARQRLYDTIGGLIDDEFGGQIVKRYGVSMTAYRKHGK